MAKQGFAACSKGVTYTYFPPTHGCGNFEQISPEAWEERKALGKELRDA